jgi:transcriptional regulator
VISRPHSAYGHRGCGHHAEESDAALAVLCALFPGRVLKQQVIAEATGLTQQGINFIERNALRKVRFRLQQTLKEMTL